MGKIIVMIKIIVIIVGTYFLVTGLIGLAVRATMGLGPESANLILLGMGCLIIWLGARRRKRWPLPLGIIFLVFGLWLSVSGTVARHEFAKRGEERMANAAGGLIAAAVGLGILGVLLILYQVSSDRKRKPQQEEAKRALDEKDIAQLGASFAERATDELKAIYSKSATDEYRTEAIEAVRRILTKRGELKQRKVWVCPKCLNHNQDPSLVCNCGLAVSNDDLSEYGSTITARDLRKEIENYSFIGADKRAYVLSCYSVKRFPSSSEAQKIGQTIDISSQETTDKFLALLDGYARKNEVTSGECGTIKIHNKGE